MSDRLRRPAVLAGIGLAVVAVVVVILLLSAGGTSRRAGSVPTATTPSSTATVTPHRRVAVKKAHPHPRTTASTATSHGAATAPAPGSAAGRAAPPGLRQTSGYSTYELCAGRCSGGVPSSLRRALHIPGPGAGGACPVSAGGGPVHPSAVQPSVMPFVGSSWSGARVTWTATSGYRGPILIRGRQVGGSGAVGFGEGHVPYDELQLLDSGMGAPAAGGGRAWLSFTRVRGPGCYGYQVDGTSFSSVIVFRAAG